MQINKNFGTNISYAFFVSPMSRPFHNSLSLLQNIFIHWQPHAADLPARSTS